MRTSAEYSSLQLAYRPERLTDIAPDALTTARFETVYRDMSGFGQLDLVFEHDDRIFVAHAVGIDVSTLATLEGPAFIWPSALSVAPEVASAIEELVTPWLLALTRGRGMAGEYVRSYRASSAFDEARARGYRGAVRSGESLVRMAPFVYARRFAAGRAVRVACADPELAAAVVATVARSVELAVAEDAFARRWYDRPHGIAGVGDVDVAIVDSSAQPAAAGVAYVVALRPESHERAVIVPVPVPQDHLFTFDAADAPQARRFAVQARDRVERAVRRATIPSQLGGSGGRVAIVVRDDAAFAGDADTDAAEELARRLGAEGLDASVMTCADQRVAAADLVHIFGGVGDSHVVSAAEIARKARIPYFASLEPLAAYATYYEDGLLAALRLGNDSADARYFRTLFYQRLLRFDNVPVELAADVAERRDRDFESVCSGAAGVFLAPCDTPEAFRARFPRVPADRIIVAPVLLGAEPQEADIAALVPAQRFLLVHAPFVRRAVTGHVIAALGAAEFGVVVSGPLSEVDIGWTLRRVAGSSVVFLPDPTPAQVAALYRRAHAVALPAVRPTGAQRLIRAVLCGAIPVVPQSSPLAHLVVPDCRFDQQSPVFTRERFEAIMSADGQPLLERLGAVIAPLGDQQRAFDAIIAMYARVPSPMPR